MPRPERLLCLNIITNGGRDSPDLSKGLGFTNSYPAHMANLRLTRCARTCYYLPMGSTATRQTTPPHRSRQRPPQCSIPSQMRSIYAHSCIKSSQIRTKTSQAPDRKRNKMEQNETLFRPKAPGSPPCQRPLEAVPGAPKGHRLPKSAIPSAPYPDSGAPGPARPAPAAYTAVPKG